jgi:hypothetical protein
VSHHTQPSAQFPEVFRLNGQMQPIREAGARGQTRLNTREHKAQINQTANAVLENQLRTANTKPLSGLRRDPDAKTLKWALRKTLEGATHD